MNYVAFQAAIWIAAGFTLVMLVIRRRKRREHFPD
jgi:multisubunit Na+/H+ antiporter MnhB subunit